MCGIVGYVGDKPCVPILIDGLRRLEYRGYDSAGVAVMGAEGAAFRTRVVRCRGKLAALEAHLATETPAGTMGMGHTRWATHGRPSDANAHPHTYGRVSVVHNGIIENHHALRERLTGAGHRFGSETDTEVIAHLVDDELEALRLAGDADRHGGSAGLLREAVRRALGKVEGSYALVVLSDVAPDCLIAARKASPLVLGLGIGETYVASDIPAILPYTRRMLFLEEGDIAELSRGGPKMFDLAGKPVVRAPREITWSTEMAEKAGFKHFMLKEIHEQPRAVADTLRGRLQVESGDAIFDGIELDPSTIRRVTIIACGTSLHAGLVGRSLIEKLARVPVEVDFASEYRYRDPIVGPGDLILAISQSGETADTLAAAKDARAKGARVLAISNVVDSSIPRASDHAIYTCAGPEIGVASTKAFTTQLAALALIALHLARRSKDPAALSQKDAVTLGRELLEIPAKMHEVLGLSTQIRALARRYGRARDFLFLGRGASYPIALEGALKLKEISYIHAEGYAAGEMKHGPIALIDEDVPVVVLAPAGPGYDKVMSNLTEVKAREGRVIAVATRGDADIAGIADDVILVPAVAPALAPLLTVMPLQLLAYYVADLKGTDIDQPRNLAKSVTVE